MLFREKISTRYCIVGKRHYAAGRRIFAINYQVPLSTCFREVKANVFTRTFARSFPIYYYEVQNVILFTYGV